MIGGPGLLTYVARRQELGGEAWRGTVLYHLRWSRWVDLEVYYSTAVVLGAPLVRATSFLQLRNEALAKRRLIEGTLRQARAVFRPKRVAGEGPH